MTPESLLSWVDALDTAGTLGLVVLAIWVFYTRRVRTKTEMDEMSALHAGELVSVRAAWATELASVRAAHLTQLAYVEERRADERATRIAAEQRLAALVDAIEKMGDALQAVQIELVRTAASGHATVAQGGKTP